MLAVQKKPDDPQVQLIAVLQAALQRHQRLKLRIRVKRTAFIFSIQSPVVRQALCPPSKGGTRALTLDHMSLDGNAHTKAFIALFLQVLPHDNGLLADSKKINGERGQRRLAVTSDRVILHAGDQQVVWHNDSLFLAKVQESDGYKGVWTKHGVKAVTHGIKGVKAFVNPVLIFKACALCIRIFQKILCHRVLVDHVVERTLPQAYHCDAATALIQQVIQHLFRDNSAGKRRTGIMRVNVIRVDIGHDDPPLCLFQVLQNMRRPAGFAADYNDGGGSRRIVEQPGATVVKIHFVSLSAGHFLNPVDHGDCRGNPAEFLLPKHRDLWLLSKVSVSVSHRKPPDLLLPLRLLSSLAQIFAVWQPCGRRRLSDGGIGSFTTSKKINRTQSLSEIRSDDFRLVRETGLEPA